jgi:rhodanese-related sulfurtransferase
MTLSPALRTPTLLALLLALGACSTPPESGAASTVETAAAAAPAPPAAGALADAEPAALPPVMTASQFVASREADAVVLDVRTPEEHAEGHLDGSVLMDVTESTFTARIAELDPSQTVYVYCRTGNRSGQAADILRANGFTRVSNIGGFDELARAGAPVAQ